MRTIQAIPFEQLHDGDMVTFYGVHVLRWNFREWGDPTMAFVDVEEPTEEQREAENFMIALCDALELDYLEASRMDVINSIKELKRK